jgi:hypothetical protein
MKMKKLPFLFIKLEKFRGQENRMLDDWVRINRDELYLDHGTALSCV